MYNVSQDYLNQIKQPYVRRALKGTVGNIAFTNRDILSGSFSVSNQCSESDEVKIGTVNTGELQLTFRRGIVERNNWKGLEIKVSDGVMIDSTGSYEYVPLGVYTVDEATHDKDGIRVTAYDNMLKFEKKWGLSSTMGQPYNILKMLCDDCGVTLGMTKTQVEALANGNQAIALYSENDCETYRDVLFWLAQLLASFATMDREGRLVLREYGTTSVDAVSAGLRFEDNEFSDFETEYSGIAYTDIDTGEYIYYGLPEDNKLPYNLGANPFLQYGTKSTKEIMCRDILNRIKNIKFVPFKTSMLSTPAYDLGDALVFSGGIADGTKKSCIMFYDYNFSSYSAEGFGRNPALANARSKTDKNVAGLMSKTDKNKIQFYTFKNADDIIISDDESADFIDIRFTTIDAKQVVFQAEMLVEAEADLDEVMATVTYHLNGAEVTDYKPSERWTEDGEHIISLYYVIDVDPNTLYRWTASVEVAGGTLTILSEQSRGMVWSQGLVALTSWSGYIDIREAIYKIEFDDIDVCKITDTMELTIAPPIHIEVRDTVYPIGLDDIDVAEIRDYVWIDRTSIHFTQMTWRDLNLKAWHELNDLYAW